MQNISQLTQTQGVSRHYPQLPELSAAIFDIMHAIELASLNKAILYKHFLKCADFAANFLNSETYFQFAKRLDENGDFCVEKTLDSTIANHSFLARAEIVRCCSNFVIKSFKANSEQLLVQLLVKAFEESQLNRVVLKETPQRVPEHAVFFAVQQLDVTLTFVLLLIFAFPLNLTFEAFDEYENVDFTEFTLKELVFNAQAAPSTVTFWFPAFSLDDKVVFEARYIETEINAETAGDDEEFKRNVEFSLTEQLKQPISRGSAAPKPEISKEEMRLLIAEEVATQIEPLKEQQKRLNEKMQELENQSGILAASEQKILLDFDKMFSVVKELNRTVAFLSRKRDSLQ